MKVSWDFLFEVMGKMMMTKEFLNMIRILLLGANPTINLNNVIIKSFEINWGIR
jgi:hypothetical protein